MRAAGGSARSSSATSGRRRRSCDRGLGGFTRDRLPPYHAAGGVLNRVISLEATLAQERWRKAVDNLWREVVYYRRARLADRERERAERRLKNLRRIVRRALSEYHRIELERQGTKNG